MTTEPSLALDLPEQLCDSGLRPRDGDAEVRVDRVRHDNLLEACGRNLERTGASPDSAPAPDALGVVKHSVRGHVHREVCASKGHSLAQAEFIGSRGSTASSAGSAGAVGTDSSDSGRRSSSLDRTLGGSSEDCSRDMDRC